MSDIQYIFNQDISKLIELINLKWDLNECDYIQEINLKEKTLFS